MLLRFFDLPVKTDNDQVLPGQCMLQAYNFLRGSSVCVLAGTQHQAIESC